MKKHHTVFATPTGDTPAYHECPACGFLSGDQRFADSESACPHCGSKGGKRRTFPTERVRRLDRRIRAYHAQGESEVVVILAAAFLEAILEDILDRILEAHGADMDVRRALMDGQRAIGVRIGKIFPQLTGEEFEDAAAELGYREFPRRWRDLRESRNAFIHDSPFNGPRESLDEHTAVEAMDLLDQAYKLFVLINNRFVADGYRRRTAPSKA